MSPDAILRKQLLQLLDGRNAHLNFEDAVANFPHAYLNARPPNVSYTPWHLVEHLRIAQWDILQFILDPDHTSPTWPIGYWPDVNAEADKATWLESIRLFTEDLHTIENLVRDETIILTADIPHAPGFTYLREFLLVADHNAYHIGEFAILRQVMGTWK